MKKIMTCVVLWASVGPVHADGATSLAQGIEAARTGYYEQAAQQLSPAAKSGNGQALFNLGLLYHGGMGVSFDEAQALQLYHAAAENGYGLAQEYLIVGYEEGWFGLPKDAQAAARWRQQAQID